MTWHYSLAKSKENGYQLIEVFANDDGGIWGCTGHSDILGWLAAEDEPEEEVITSILSTLEMVAKDLVTRPVLDLDTLEVVDADFKDDLEHMIDNLMIDKDADEGS